MTATCDTTATRTHLTPLFMLRVGGLPFDVVEPLRCVGAAGWAETVLAAEDALAVEKDAVADAIQAAVGRSDDERLRRRLLDLRRDVYNGRLPRDPAAADALLDLLADDDRERAARWLARRARYEQVLARGRDQLAADVDRGRAHLRALAGHPHLRNGLLLASPSLDRYLPTYLDAPDGPLGKRARRIERSLVEYVLRTACKTSPFSTLTAVSLGRFEPDGRWALSADGVDGPWRSHPRLNIAALARIADVIVADPVLRADLPVEVTSGCRADADRIRYVRRSRVAGDDESAVSFDSVQETLFYLSAGSFMDELLATVADRPGIRFGDLARLLHDSDPNRRTADDVDRYLRHLLRLNLLTVPALRVDIHDHDPVAGFRDRVAGIGRPWATDLADRLDQVRDDVAGFRDADLAGRRRIVDAVRAELVDAHHGLGRSDATTPRTLVYDDVTTGGAVRGDNATWERDLVPALANVARLLPLFDVMLPHRLMLDGFFRARHARTGRCDDLVRFVHEFHQDVYDEYAKATARRTAFDASGEYVPQENWFRLPEIDALDDARRELVTRMRRAYAALPPGATELVLDDELVDAVAARLPDDGRALDPRSFFLQLADVDGLPLAVVNRCYTGLTLLFSRFAHCFAVGADGSVGADPELVSLLRAELADLTPPGAVFAELTGGYDTTNLNLHPAVMPYELVCPGETSFRPAAQQIPVEDLSIVRDPGTGRPQLRSRTLDKVVIPVYLGFLLPLALPEMQRVLLSFSYTALAELDLFGGTLTGGHPRVRHGDLVLARRTWKLDPAGLPRRVDAVDDAGWYLAWQRWRRDNEVPRRVFVTGRKPQYVDLESAFCLTVLDGIVKDATGPLVVTEMLPDPDQLWLRTPVGRHVTEQTVEITTVRSAP